LIYQSLRADDLCDINLCPQSPGNGERCDDCPRDRLYASMDSPAGRLLSRVLDLRLSIRMGITVGMGDIDADELVAMAVVEEEMEKFRAERSKER
jgi:hypothetical protein